MTTHEFAKILLESPNVQMVFGRNESFYEFHGLVNKRIGKNEKIERDKKVEQVFWISEPFK